MGISIQDSKAEAATGRLLLKKGVSFFTEHLRKTAATTIGSIFSKK